MKIRRTGHQEGTCNLESMFSLREECVNTSKG